MWSKVFESLWRRMTCIYACIFGTLILLIVFAAYTFIWWEIVAHEREELVQQVYHEAEEWVDSGEVPCSTVAVQEASMLAYFVTMDDQRVILNQLGESPQGRALWRHRNDWPKKMESTRILRMHGGKDEDPSTRYRYLAAVAPVVKNGETVGKLYMFENIEFYYTAAFKTLFKLLCIAVLLFVVACYFGYWLAGKNIQPISKIYARQMQFTADASHEMRTPLAVMALATQGLQEDEDSHYSDFAKESLAMLHSETERMSRLTENLMELARGDEGQRPDLKQKVDVTALCQRVAQQLALLGKDKGLALKSQIDNNLRLVGDEAALNRLLIILVDNAIKYSPVGSIVTLVATKSKSRLLVEVQDQGCGISDEDKEKVFDRFYRVDKARSRSQGGLGLGLSLAQTIVRQHGGEIKILDNKPQGTIMQVFLPFNQA
ncbi:MAG: sensor histidine kinase [Phascolarctobacterium sp.]